MAKSFWNRISISFGLDQHVERLFNELIYEPWGHPPDDGSCQPTFEIQESSSAYIIEADAPGLSPESVHVFIQGNRLVIRGRRETAEVSRTRCSICVERIQKTFSRQFPLTSPVDADRIAIEFDNGVMRVTVPKRLSRIDN